MPSKLMNIGAPTIRRVRVRSREEPASSARTSSTRSSPAVTTSSSSTTSPPGKRETREPGGELRRARHPRRARPRRRRTSSSTSPRRPTCRRRSRGPTHDADVNVVGTVQVLEAARAAGRAGRLHLDRRRDLRRVRRARRPRTRRAHRCSPYGIAKLCAEEYLARLEPHPRPGARRRCASATSTGRGRTPSLEGGVVAIFLERLRAASRRRSSATAFRTRDFVYVGDVVDGMLAAAGRARRRLQRRHRQRDERARPAPGVRSRCGRRRGAPFEPSAARRPPPLRRSTSPAPPPSSAGAPTSLDDGLARTWEWMKEASREGSAKRTPNLGLAAPHPA